MLEKKQIQAIFYSSSKWIVKQQRQRTTSTMHLAQELLMNVQCSHGSERFGKERRALTVRPAIGSWQGQLRAIIETWSSSTTQEIAKEVTINHSTVIWHLKQIGKVNKWQVGDSWADHKSKKKKSSFWSVFVSCSRQQWTISWSDCDIQWKVVFIQQLALTSSVIGPRRTSKTLPKVKFVPIKGHRHCLVVYCLSDPLQLSESQWNYYIWDACSANQRDALKTAKPTPDIDQQKGPNSSAWQHPTHACNCF